MDDLSGGTFTISNGGVYGSMLSTPIINRPQSGILGMHNIQKRAVVINDEIVIRPMMYLALSYDHRIIDGKESVGFLVSIKNLLENQNIPSIELRPGIGFSWASIGNDQKLSLTFPLDIIYYVDFSRIRLAFSMQLQFTGGNPTGGTASLINFNCKIKTPFKF